MDLYALLAIPHCIPIVMGQAMHQVIYPSLHKRDLTKKKFILLKNKTFCLSRKIISSSNQRAASSCEGQQQNTV